MLRAIAGVLLAALALLAHGRAGAAETLQVAVEDEASPWSSRDGTGFANDLVLAAFRAVGVEVELRVVPYERCKRMVVHGDVAACFSMSEEPGLAASVAFPRVPLFRCKALFFEAAAHPVPAARPEELRPGTSVATVRAYEYPDAFDALVLSGRVRVDESVSEDVALQRLAAGRVELALVMVDGVVKLPEHVVRSAGVEGKVRARFTVGANDSFIGFSRRHPRGAWALERFEEGMRRIRADGTAGRIEAAWRARLGSRGGGAP